MQPNKTSEKRVGSGFQYILRIFGKYRQKSLWSLYANQGKRTQRVTKDWRLRKAQFNLLTYQSVYYDKKKFPNILYKEIQRDRVQSHI